jgi:putative ABC transport system permease protein
MRALDKKLWRDLWYMRGMAAAISLVMIGGISTFVMSRVTYESLKVTQARYYIDQRFADVFARLVRAPESVAERFVELPGVNQVETRVVAPVNLEVEGFDDPITGRILSLPEFGEPVLNVPWLRRGRLPGPRADDEIAINEDFAIAHGFQPGDRIVAIIRGHRKRLDIVGIVLSPEYMYAIPPGAIFPDYERYGILWMNRKALATAYDMDGAFNDVTFSLQRGASERDLIDRVDIILARYGGLGAYGREDQFSHRFVNEELRGLETMATIFPVIFLGVAAFLLNVVISRLVATEREQIGTLKAFGYSTLQVGMHYIKLVLAITGIGLLAGVALGLRFARGLGGIYQEFYSFPYLHFELDPLILLQAVLVTMVAALAGTAFAVRRAAALPPAEGMRPEPPPVYRATILERIGLQQRLAEPSRMIVRHIARRPLKAALTMLGIAAACGILTMTNFQRDAIDWMVGVQYGLSSREDLSVMFTDPTPRRALYSLRDLQGVEHVEGFRSVPARLVHGHRSYRTAVDGIEPGGELHRVLDAALKPVAIPPEGVVLTEYLAREILRIAPGQMLTIEVLEGNRPVIRVPVVGTTHQYLGVNAYMDRQTINRLMREGPAISGARLAVDAEREVEIYRALRGMPRVAGTIVRDTAIEQFNEMMEETIIYFAFVTALLGGFIAFGVVYNSARIALSERSRELASLRVLGFTRGEVGYILLGEIGLLTLAAIPLGFLFGNGLSYYLALAFSSDLYRIPLIVAPSTYALSASIVLVSFAISGVLIWRKLSRLDLIEVLKTRE